jgi:DNA-3-methyladenine glycosylase
MLSRTLVLKQAVESCYIIPMNRLLKQSFFQRSVLEVAPDLLGKYLVRCIDGKETAYRITDVEAYDGERDQACHASKGRTARTEVMYGAAGYWYVYLIYGLHNIVNIVTNDTDYPAAVMIRGIEGVDGPGRVTKALAITRDLNTSPALKESGLWIEDRGLAVNHTQIVTSPRIGVEYAGEWANKPWRFRLRSSED